MSPGIAFTFVLLVTVCVGCLWGVGHYLRRRRWREAAKWAGLALAYFALSLGLALLDLWARGELG